MIRCARKIKTVRPTGRNAGFTIIELIVGLVLLGLTMTVLAQALGVVSKGWDRANSMIGEQDMLSRGLQVLRRDLQGMQRIVWHGDKKPEFAFAGDRNAMFYIVTEPPYPSQSGMFLVSLSQEGNRDNRTLIRKRASYHPDIDSFKNIKWVDEVPLLEGPYDYQFSYLEKKRSGKKWYNKWPHKDRMPALLRLHITSNDPASPIVPDIFIRPLIEIEYGCVAKEPKLCALKDGKLHKTIEKTAQEKKKQNPQ